MSIRPAREVAHEIANRFDAACADHEVLGWSHGHRCDAALEAIEADRAAFRKETHLIIEALSKAVETVNGGGR